MRIIGFGGGDVPLLVAGAIFFFVLLSFQGNPRVPFLLKGALAQLQVLISIFVTAVVPKRGFITMGTCNLAAALAVAIVMFSIQDFSLLPGVVVPIGTSITLVVLSLLFRQLFRQYHEVRRQQTALQQAHDEIEAHEAEMALQNRQLVNYSRILEENERKLAWLASYDSLTSLPNRKRFMDRLGERIQSLGGESKSGDGGRGNRRRIH